MIGIQLEERLEVIAKALLVRGFESPFALLSSLPMPKKIKVESGVFHCFKDDEIPVLQRAEDLTESMVYATSMEGYRRLRAQKAALVRWHKHDKR